MAAEPETLQPPPELPIATAPSAPEETAADPTTTTTVQQQPAAENPGPPPLAPKRQRRPSVRLGEIGDQRASATNHETHTRRPSMPPWSWRIRSKEPSRTNSKARSLTNLPNGGEEIAEFGNKRGKSKRASTVTKRVRSNFAPRTTVTTAAAAAAKTENNNNDNGEEEAYRDFDYEQEDEDYHDDSPVHSVHDDDGYWHIGRHTDRARVSENDVVESDSREGRKCEGVRSWLLELGLSRYAPMFEIHEVDDELLPMLTLEDLKDMGINAVGSRRKMYTAIQKLRKGFP